MIHHFSLLFCFGKVLAPHNTVWETCFLLNKIKCSLSDVLSHVKIPFPLTEIKRKRRKDTFSLVSCEPESVLLFSFIFLFSFFIILFLLFSLNAINYSPRCFFAEQNVVQVYNQYLLIAKTKKKSIQILVRFLILYYFTMDGQLTSSCYGLLGALLPSDPSWYHLSALVPSWSSS